MDLKAAGWAWTRLAIISVAGGVPDLGPTVDRLMRNQDDIGNAIKPICGAAAGDKLTALPKEHTAITADLLVAAKGGAHGLYRAGGSGGEPDAAR